jgi:hypothetical protein
MARKSELTHLNYREQKEKKGKRTGSHNVLQGHVNYDLNISHNNSKITIPPKITS